VRQRPQPETSANAVDARIRRLPITPAPDGNPGSRQRGFTLVELALIVAIVAILATLAVTTYQGYRERVRINQAVGDLLTISTSITEFNADYKRLPADLAEVGKDGMRDPWGNAYLYINHTTEAKGHWRKDKNIVPINSDFDLSSAGPDGNSQAPLTAKASRDDIIRANDGSFIGLASVYDP
jgi:general secretion pathway protein G